jgi:hypothetical protein
MLGTIDRNKAITNADCAFMASPFASSAPGVTLQVDRAPITVDGGNTAPHFMSAAGNRASK